MHPLDRLIVFVVMVFLTGFGATGIQADWNLPYPSSVDYPSYPYPETDYREQYRDQFHFSSKAGWMNDVNGPIYVDGVYHLFYQHYPYSLGWDKMHWGHATSLDMVHWVQQPIALDPHIHPRYCWSGSSTLDVNNTSGLKAGDNDPIVLLYTATDSGTCLAYSNDNAVTFQSYSGNPLIPDNPGMRDPKVFWYEPTQRWIFVIYHRDGEPRGVRFYSSTNLINWTLESKFFADSFFECADFYELAIDGDRNNRKWVLQDGKGEYWIGDFNGQAFSCTWGPYRMDPSEDFYASQTFANMPGGRTVQMAWLRDRGVMPPILPDTIWRCQDSFPCELSLKTFSDGVRLTRTPIEEISHLYEGETLTWNDVQITSSSSSNSLAGIESREYQLIAEFDVTGATATEFGLKFHVNAGGGEQVRITYNLPNQRVDGPGGLTHDNIVPLENNRIRLHALVDWSQFELFAGGGRMSFTDYVAWHADENGMAVWANGDVTLAYLQFNELGRAWDPYVPIPEPTNLQATASGQTIELSWQDNSSGDDQEDGFAIERKPYFNSDSWYEVGRVGADTTTYTDTENIYGLVTYTYRVGAVKD